MNNKDFYNLFEKTDLTDVEPPDFSLPQHKKNFYVRKSMKKIMEYEKSNFRYTEKKIKIQRRGISILASAILLSLMFILLFNITIVLAFIKNLFYVPGIGITDNENLISAVLNEPTLIITNGGEYMLEFATKVKREDGRCEILLYFSSDSFIRETNIPLISTNINGNEYVFTFDDYGYSNNYYSYFTVTNNDFPDVNSFNLKIHNTTTNIIMSELSDEEKKPNLSNEINGIRLVAYKYRKNNSLFGLDVISDNEKDNGFLKTISFNNLTIYDDDGNIINTTGYYGKVNPPRNDDYGLGYNFISFKNNENKKISKISVSTIGVIYQYDTVNFAPIKITIPIPEDGKTVYTDIRVSVGGLVYELTEVRREGNILYFEDNCRRYDVPETSEAVENQETYIEFVFMTTFNQTLKINENEKTITNFNPDDTHIEMEISSFIVKYYGDFIINFD